MKYHYILFDMDGTILDTLEDLQDSVNYCLSGFHMPPISIEQAAHYLGNGASHLIECAVPPGTEKTLLEQVLAMYIPYYQAHSRIKTAPYAGIREMMVQLKNAGAHLAVVSNKPHAAVCELARIFFPDLLDAVIGETKQVRRKPAPDSVLQAMQEMNVSDRDDCVYIGDTEVDIQTAKNADMDVIAVSWGFRSEAELKSAGAEKIAHSVEELKSFLCDDTE